MHKVKKSMAQILGIDPGLQRLGWGVVRKEGQNFSAVGYDCFQTDSQLPMIVRLDLLYQQVILLIEKYHPDYLSVESLFFNTNAKTALAVGHARGVILLAGQHKNIKLLEFTPLQIKMFLTGYGRADKNQIQQMVKTLLKLKSAPRSDDAADGLACALCAAFSLDNIHDLVVKRKN